MFNKEILMQILGFVFIFVIVVSIIFRNSDLVGEKIYNAFEAVLGYELFSEFSESEVNLTYKLTSLQNNVVNLEELIINLQTENRTLGGEVYKLQNPIEPIVLPKKVLVVVGHRASSPGTVYGGAVEYEMNYTLGQKIMTKLQTDKRFAPTISHTGSDYSTYFLNYFETYENTIKNYFESHKVAYLKANPAALSTAEMDHNKASSFGSTALYGLNLWAVNNKYDLVVHLHFNDYPRTNTNKPGQYSGFAVYVPLKANENFTDAVAFAKLLENELLGHFKRSSQPKEASGILESELIAMGSHNTLGSIPAVLLEGGYIYETQFRTSSAREKALNWYASDVYDAMTRYFY